MKNPTISFLISHYNRPKSLLKCIQSIKNLSISQDYEIIVSDDYSKSEIVDIIQDYEFIKLILAKENTGLASNINRGIKACSGEYIIYVQEDFAIKEDFSFQIDSLLETINSTSIDMIRLSSIVKYHSLKPINDIIDEIPRFSLKNFFIEQFRYSDNPYIVKKSFFERYGYYKDGVNTSYGENEYMVRMMKLNPRIALCKNHLAYTFNLEGSIREENSTFKRNKRIIDIRRLKKLKQLLRSLRFKLEFILYNPKKRKLYTFKNLRA